MGLVTYYHFRPRKGRNNKKPWAVAHNPGRWLRSLAARGWTWKREVYTREMTAEEEALSRQMNRYFGGRYESLEKLLEDEREILGADSREYRELESALRKIEGDTNMATKTVKNTKNGTDAAEKTAYTPAFDAREIEIGQIRPSPLKSQEKRRKRFDREELERLADNIRRHGVINPITVRPAGSHFEIVAGERRYLAARQAGLAEIPATIKNLSDEEAAEIQMIENLQRADVHPLDEAFAYQDMKDVLKIDETEIALRVGKSVSYVLNRLKLLGLHKKVQKSLEDGELPLRHALEISKYPKEAQEEIFNYAFFNYGYPNQAVFPLTRFIERIQKEYLLQLKRAPFSTKSNELRKDGLACTECPERTGANPLLFSENYSDEDKCLNRACWESKVKAHVQIQRRKLAETDYGLSEPEKVEKKAQDVPLLVWEWYAPSYVEEKYGKVLSRGDYTQLEKKDECESAERGVFVTGDRIGQSQWICRDKDCKKHGSAGQTIANAASRSGEAAKIRKEEILDAKVAEATRRRVLKKAAGQFDANNTIFTHKNAENYLLDLLARLWKLQCSYSEHTARVICETLGFGNTRLSTSKWDSTLREQIAALTADERSKLLFLLLTAHECEIYSSSWTYHSQRKIKEMAEDFGIDYRIIDAEERLAAIPMRFKDVHRHYLQELEAGRRDAKVPRVYSSKWKPVD
jgi:ParB family chromosome partitioning protein